MKLKQTITLGATLMTVGAIAIGISTALPARSAQPVAEATAVVQSNEPKNVVCSNASDSFAQDESSFLAAEYSQAATANCLFVGCGGIF